MKDVLAKVWISGRVQGVGFRFFVYQLTSRFGLNGIVKNLYDGQVYTEVEGDKEIIQVFLKELKIGNRWSHVNAVNVEWEVYSGKYKNFEVTF